MILILFLLIFLFIELSSFRHYHLPNDANSTQRDARYVYPSSDIFKGTPQLFKCGQ